MIQYKYIYIYFCIIVLVKYTICIRFLYSVVKDGQSVLVIKRSCQKHLETGGTPTVWLPLVASIICIFILFGPSHSAEN